MKMPELVRRPRAELSYGSMPQGSPRLVIVSNRLPVTVKTDDQGAVTLESSPGGLATGLRGAHERWSGVWIGWPGDTSTLTPAQQVDVQSQFDRQHIVPVHLTAEEVHRFYEGFSNGVVWPLFHYLLDRVPLDANDWASYEDANRRFADAVASVYRPGDMVWVHDYQLMLVPSMLRERVPRARIGFFLHIPFPSFEAFRILPWRQQLLEGLLGADLIGFHTSAYVRYCLTSIRHILDLEPDGQHVSFGGRTVKLAAFPMGIDVPRFEEMAGSDQVKRDMTALRKQANGRRLLLGVDRLDYTKGIPRRLLAFERLLKKHPEWRDKIRFVQVAVPSRLGAEAYKAYGREVNELVGRINGAAGTVTDVPVHYINRGISAEELSGLYRAADVMLVTPLRDGMNLVAKEFVASRLDDDGVLVLSEFAGAADELGEALVVNPYDIDTVADTIARALTMSGTERQARMRALRRRVKTNSVQTWTSHFLDELDRISSEVSADTLPISSNADFTALVTRIRQARRIMLLLDYDGTLVPLADTPELAKPDAALLELLQELHGQSDICVHVLSGRGRDVMDGWLGELPVGLWAEHALWRRDLRTQKWRAAFRPNRDWLDRVRPLLERTAWQTPGSLIEYKGDSLAWHYRMSDPLQAVEQGGELRARIHEMFGGDVVETIGGSKVIEVRPRGVHKGLALQALAREEPMSTLFVAIGDDRTDEDLFEHLPATGIAIHVGPEASRAAYRLPNVSAVRRLLREISATPPARPKNNSIWSYFRSGGGSPKRITRSTR
jgi:trehalose 6-phosphate synthase/phosphatase